MQFVKESLSESIYTGFIDKLNHSNSEYLPQMVVNDSNLGKKVLSTIVNELKRCDEFWFSVAFVTTSGVATIINNLVELDKKNIRGRVLVSQYLNFSQPEALKTLLKFNNIELKIAVSGKFHSKGYLFKNGELNNLIIGSSNLTANALCENTEWNLKISATPESYIINNVIREFTTEFQKATKVDKKFILGYEKIYARQKSLNKLISEESHRLSIVTPNSMQKEAMESLIRIRKEGKRRALLISATGTGKTYLSAFDAKSVNPKKMLFIVHRLNIATAAMNTFKLVFSGEKKMGLFSGSKKELNNEFLFSTIQTISRKEHLAYFKKDEFDYIVIDETHRAGAESYQSILDFFEPAFLLGMTATPERTDGFDIFKLFDYTIAYQIRLHRALSEDMLSPFHYYGVSDIEVEGRPLEDLSDFRKLVSTERVDRILEVSKLYGSDNGIVRGLVFCSNKKECIELSKIFNERGLNTVSLTSESTEDSRLSAISRLESDDFSIKLDYIFTVDIFNEGVDIPRVNQVIMLRPTQSAIVFVQQLGRGLRKAEDKEYLTVIDFIGNYNNNYLVPIALYGDTSYNKDNLRKLMASGSSLIPGCSTVSFDEISQKRIFESINNANLTLRRDLLNDYNLLKFRLGRPPMMCDFLDYESRDPYLYVEKYRSYFNFFSSVEKEASDKLNQEQKKLLELFCLEIANSKRIHETTILQELFKTNSLDIIDLRKILKSRYDIDVTSETIFSCVRNLNFDFVKSTRSVVEFSDNKLYLTPAFSEMLSKKEFKIFLEDALEYSKRKFNMFFKRDKYIGGFVLYQKYSRKDVCRILNWEKNEDSTMYGYRIKLNTCPVFVNYHKEESIAASTKFDDRFISNSEFQWFSKPRRKLNSADVLAIKNHNEILRIPLFVKKKNSEGGEFYFIGDLAPIENSFVETSIIDDKGNPVSVVKIIFSIKQIVDDSIYDYITTG